MQRSQCVGESQGARQPLGLLQQQRRQAAGSAAAGIITSQPAPPAVAPLLLRPAAVSRRLPSNSVTQLRYRTQMSQPSKKRICVEGAAGSGGTRSPRAESSEMDPTRKVALVTGITGQDGSYLTDFLLEKGYEVHGVIRRASSFNTGRIDHVYKDPHRKDAKMFLHFGDMTDTGSLIALLRSVWPREVYNLAAQSHVAVSFQLPEYTGVYSSMADVVLPRLLYIYLTRRHHVCAADADGMGVLRLLEAIRTVGLTEYVRFYQASTSELYGKVQEVPQKETTPFYPRSPYAVAKMFAYWMCINYRESYNMCAPQPPIGWPCRAAELPIPGGSLYPGGACAVVVDVGWLFILAGTP
jgi:hypothetical protein